MRQHEQFSNRWGIILAALGMAIGAGNLWRFPRLAGQYGGTFIILWIVFLLIWSIPILLAEFAIGKQHKKGVIGSFAAMAGKKYTWGGFFITLCTLGITFYYSVVTAWALRYVGFSAGQLWGEPLARKLAANPDYLQQYWTGVSSGSPLTIAFFIASILAGVALLSRGVQKGLETANKFLIPSLFGLLAVISIVALNMEGGVKGLDYMFSIRPDDFSNPKVWIEALSQSAWSTGAGWGLLMTISAYSRNQEDVTLNTFAGAFGNNTASLLSGVAVLPAVFALAPTEAEAVAYLQSGNQSLTFTIIPRLFATLPGGAVLGLVFFVAFFLAAFSSFLTMVEMFIKNLADLGLARRQATLRVALFCVIFGFPSAYYLEVFNNQDWVWGIGLVVSGLLIAAATLKHGAARFKKAFIDQDSDFRVPTRYFSLCMGFNLPFGLVLIWWWMSQGYSDYPWFDQHGTWNVLDEYSNASILTQWGLVFIAGALANGYLYRKFAKKS